MHKSFTRKKGSLSYIHDSDISSDSTDYCVTIKTPTISHWQMNGPGMVRKVRASAVPLLIFNSWNCEYDYFLGKDGISDDIPSFIQNSLVKESGRSGSFKATTQSCASNLALEIEVDSIAAKGPYRTEGYFFFVVMAYGYGTTEYAGEGTAFSRFRYTLKRGEQILLEDQTTARRVSMPLQKSHNNPQALRSFYNSNLVEALSGTIKANIEAIVEDINLLLYEERAKKTREASLETEPVDVN